MKFSPFTCSLLDNLSIEIIMQRCPVKLLYELNIGERRLQNSVLLLIQFIDCKPFQFQKITDIYSNPSDFIFGRNYFQKTVLQHMYMFVLQLVQ